MGVPLPVRAVLFDLDNTLLDFMRLKRVASDAAGRAMVAAGADFPFAADDVGDILFGEYLEDIEGNEVFMRFLRKHHRQRLALSQHHVDRITASAVNAYLRAKLLQLDPFPGVRRVLLELGRRGYRMGVLTDAPRFKAYQRLDAAQLCDAFDFVVTATDHGAQKPDRRTFAAALDRFGMAPHEVLMVGDWSERDIAGAKDAGMPAAYAAYGRPGGLSPPEADFVLARPEDLLEHLPSLVAMRQGLAVR